MFGVANLDPLILDQDIRHRSGLACNDEGVDADPLELKSEVT
jgi:hypothetical protein